MQRKIITLALALLTVVFSSTAVSAAEVDLLNKIGHKIEQHAVIRAEFTQTKQMQALKRPLITTGKLTYSRSYGVLWQILQPYNISYVLGEDKIIEIDANGLRKERSFRDVPGLAQVGRVFRAILGANVSALNTYFEVTAQGDTDKWKLALIPRQQQLLKSLSLIELSGGQFVETIIITEASGDTATLRFRKTLGATDLIDTELQLFSTPTASLKTTP
ncbi:MAG: outer membrane lipoprotein carrier protein LolA [Methylotenera sp.]|nr:outer membrane lipoprotein carrier protein LolA [Methylotenera sp.]